MDTFTCTSCSKQFPVSQAMRISFPLSAGLFIATLGGVFFGKLCPNCQSEIAGFGVIGGLFGIVLLIVLGAKWLWS